MRLQRTLNFLYLYLNSTAANHVIAPADDAETATVGMNLSPVVGLQNCRTNLGSVYHQTTLSVQTDTDRVKRRIPVTGVRTA